MCSGEPAIIISMPAAAQYTEWTQPLLMGSLEIQFSCQSICFHSVPLKAGSLVIYIPISSACPDCYPSDDTTDLVSATDIFAGLCRWWLISLSLSFPPQICSELAPQLKYRHREIKEKRCKSFMWNSSTLSFESQEVPACMWISISQTGNYQVNLLPCRNMTGLHSSAKWTCLLIFSLN